MLCVFDEHRKYIDNHRYNNQSLSPIIIPNRNLFKYTFLEAKLVASGYPAIIVALYNIV